MRAEAYRLFSNLPSVSLRAPPTGLRDPGMIAGMNKLPKTILRRPGPSALGSGAGGGLSPAATLEVQRDDLIEKRERVARRLSNARQHTASTLATKRHLYSEPGADENAIKIAERANSEARGTEAGLADLLSEIERDLAAVEARIVERNAQAARDQHAAERRAAADELAEAGRSLDAATAALAECYERFRLASYGAIVASNFNPSAPEELIGTVRGVVMHVAFPNVYTSAGGHTGRMPGQLIGAELAKLHAEIEAARTGGANVVRLRPAPALARHATVRLVLSQPAFYFSEHGQRVIAGPGACDLPEPIAATAFANEVAFGVDTPQGMTIARLVADPLFDWIAPDGHGGFRAVMKGHQGFRSEQPPPEPINLGQVPVFADMAEAAQ